jgi:hypothetical protein
MPDDDPGACVGDDARKVAEYIDVAFYSPAAQSRNAPPRRALSRLTVRQYRNTLTDLIGQFRATNGSDGVPGLRGQYFKKKEFKEPDRFLDRVDSVIHFEFGFVGPEPEIESETRFETRWEGSVLAQETGEYKFIVRSDQAIRLWVNDPNHPLIDAWVKSGDDFVFEAPIYLLGGRSYPIRLEFSKIMQGADNSKAKVEPKEAPASISLEWAPPRRATEVITARNLSTVRASEVFVSTTPFPPDDRSVGYERGTAISKAWDQATTDAAIEVAEYVARHLPELSGVDTSNPNRAKGLRDFVARFAERAFRRPLTVGQKALYVDRDFQEAPNLETAVKCAVLRSLKSPRFLYRELGSDGESDAFDNASRVSFGLWDSLPDPDLLGAAVAGRLSTRQEITRETERRVNDPRTRAKLREFLLQWIRVQPTPDLAKDPILYPGVDASVASDLRTSLELFLDDVVWTGDSHFRRLLLEDGLYLNGRLARVYDIDLPADAGFRKVNVTSRSGLLTHPYLLANLSYPATSSPIHRGVFVTRSLLGRALRPPPQAVAPLAPELHSALTTRERVTLQTRPAACLSCHGMINALGFGLEGFDAVGRFRTEENGRPVDSTGALERRDGTFAVFDGALGLALLLAESDEVAEAFASQLFHYLIKQPIRAYGPRALGNLHRGFAEDHYDIRRLIVRAVVTSALPP